MRYIICTDGSAIGNGNGFDSAASYVIINEELSVMKSESFSLPGKTNNYAEMFSIYKAVQFLLNIEIPARIKEVLIISDSKLSVSSLTEWFEGWYKKAKDEVLINSSKKPVINQELIKSTYIGLLMLDRVVDIRILHINSHQSESNLKSMYEKISKKININYKEFIAMYKGNDACDKLAKRALDIRG